MLFQKPKLQQVIVDLLTQFGVLEFVFIADIYKIYRQLLILPEYNIFPGGILHMTNSPILTTNTLMYGVNCAPFHALRVLESIALDECLLPNTIHDKLTKQHLWMTCVPMLFNRRGIVYLTIQTSDERNMYYIHTN